MTKLKPYFILMAFLTEIKLKAGKQSLKIYLAEALQYKEQSLNQISDQQKRQIDNELKQGHIL